MPLPRIKPMASWHRGRLFRNTAHAGIWSALRAALQAVTLVLLARAFGADGYGALSGTMALYITVAQFVGFGTGISLLRHLSRAGQGHAKLHATQRVYFLTGFGFFLAAWPLSLWLFRSHLSPFALANLAFAELVVAPALLPLVYRYQASEQLSVSGGLLTVAPIARCTAILAAMLFPTRSMDAFAAFYLASLIAAVGLAMWLLWPRAEASSESQSTSTHIREGLPFAVSGATAVASGELDKTMMLRFGGDMVTGQYSAASRVMQAALLPVYSLVIAVAPRWFRGNGVRGIVASSASLFAAAFAYSIFAAITIWMLAPYLPWLLGDGFGPSVEVLRLLTAAIITGSARQIMVMLLTTSDLQGARNRIEIFSILLALGIMLALIPRYSSAGAVIALVVSDLFILALGFMALVRHDNHARSRGLP
jgi:O-antigen/teichoic acid export membrane protein